MEQGEKEGYVEDDAVLPGRAAWHLLLALVFSSVNTELTKQLLEIFSLCFDSSDFDLCVDAPKEGEPRTGCVDVLTSCGCLLRTVWVMLPCRTRVPAHSVLRASLLTVGQRSPFLYLSNS